MSAFSEIGNVHRLVLTSLRVLQYQLQLPIYIYIHTHTVTCKIGRSTNPAKFAHKLEKAQTNTNTQPMHQPTKICALPLVDQQFSNLQSAHTKFCPKLFSGRETPLLLHTAENYLIFVRLNSSTLKKKTPRARSARLLPN